MLIIESCASRSITELPRNETTHNVESNKEESICGGTTSNEETNITSNCHCEHSSTQQQPVPQLTESYTPIVHYLSDDDSVASIVGDTLDTTQPLGLVGLHTCGDLACTVLRQFVQELVIIQSVCLVGCCYHHITEERDVTGSRSLYSVYVHKQAFQVPVCLVGFCYHHITEKRDVTGSRPLYSVYVHKQALQVFHKSFSLPFSFENNFSMQVTNASM